MPKIYLTNIDLTQNELLNAVIQPLSSAPSSPLQGQIYFNTVSKTYQYYDGTTWQTVADTAGGGGTVTSVSVASANGFAGTVATSTSTPAITLTTSVTGVLKGNGTAISVATAGTDYLAPTGSGASLTGLTQSQISGLTAALALLAPLASPALTGTPTAPTATSSTNTTQLATTAFVQAATSALSQGLQIKPTATVATTAALPSNTYSNGTAGVGATLTATANAVLTIDTHAVALNDIILVMNEATTANNGLYVCTTAGASGVAYVLTRHSDMNVAADFSGAFIPVGNAGSVNANSLWLCNPSGTVTVGTTSTPFTQLNGATDLIAGSGVTITGNTIAVASSTPHKYATSVGNGSSTSITVTHSLGTLDVMTQVYTNSGGAVVECDIANATTNTVTLTFGTAPTSNQYRVVIIG